MATYLEDPVWQRVQEEITRREYGKIQSRERSRQWELHRRRIEEACDQQFESFKPKMAAAITKVLMVQKTLLVQLGKVCGSLLRGFLSPHYQVYNLDNISEESWAMWLSQWQASEEEVVKEFSKRPAPVNVQKLGNYLNEDLCCCFRDIDIFRDRDNSPFSPNYLKLDGWENIENLYTNFGHLVKEMEPIRTTFSEDVAVREERLHYQRKRIEAFLNAIVRVLAKLKYDLDKNSLTVRARWWLNMQHRRARGDYLKSGIFEGIATRIPYTVFLRETGRYDCGASWDAYFDSMSKELHPDVASCNTRWDSGDYLDNISRDFYKALGATGPD
jgi:hypothetical protein